MKRILLFALFVFIFKFSFSFNPDENDGLVSNDNSNTTEFTTELNSELSTGNYQQFKFQVINFETQPDFDYANLKKRKKKKDNMMLYVAGGLAVATGVLILANDPENFTSNSASSVNLGIAVGGTVACGLFLAKYFIDRGK